ncbi:helix-turn-helix domain-containing protein [Paenibacillus durus]|uniref:HTH cro/C1-type domain-containing protein n=1 Tax=Paenibacillus durus TaxID=44251 RepID=A0A089HJS8_PAEDU|nr:helix-turn-helix transcriptional regulator [Paenibacillus durus]AIQ11352.1 hypothetical protein PDUR_04620 [Paenibacillus durus]
MNGFEFIAKAFNATYTDIAKRLNLTTSTVADWASGRRPIPKNKLPLLSKLFKIDEEYFKKKELTQVEKIEIEINYLKRASKRDSEQIPETIIDEDGNQLEVYSWFDPHEGDLRYKYEELEYEKLNERLRKILEYDFNLEFQFQRSKNHFHVVRHLADLLEEDEGGEGIEDHEEITDEEAERRKKIHVKIDVLNTLLQFLNGGKLFAFGENDKFDVELFHLLRRYEVIETEAPEIEENEEPFDRVDPNLRIDKSNN